MIKDVKSHIENLRYLSNTSIKTILNIINSNTDNIKSALNNFLENINYDEINNNVTLNDISCETINISTLLNVNNKFSVDVNGNIISNSLTANTISSKSYIFKDFNDFPEIGIPGEIVYTGSQNTNPLFGETFIGYLDNKGWVDLANQHGTYFKSVEYAPFFTVTSTTPVPVITLQTDNLPLGDYMIEWSTNMRSRNNYKEAVFRILDENGIMLDGAGYQRISSAVLHQFSGFIVLNNIQGQHSYSLTIEAPNGGTAETRNAKLIFYRIK